MAENRQLPLTAQLPNLGPKSQEILAAVGINSVEQLRELGSIAAYALAKKSGANVSLNLLWALEAALTGKRWHVTIALNYCWPWMITKSGCDCSGLQESNANPKKILILFFLQREKARMRRFK